MGYSILIDECFAEESIFRFGIVSPLFGMYSVASIAFLLGLVFGQPHYFRMPSGVIGAKMAGFLGWLLALILFETNGLLIAWSLHFVQDVVIIGSMIWMSRK